MARQGCIAVVPDGSCPECGWSFGKPFIDGGAIAEPHPVMPYGKPGALVIKNLCTNCGEPWNLDAVKCSSCDFLAASTEMRERLRQEKNALRLKQLLTPLPAPQPGRTAADSEVKA